MIFNLAGNQTLAHRSPTSAELFKDMSALAPWLASQAGPNRRPIPVEQFLSTRAQGDKARIKKVYVDNLDTVASSNTEPGGSVDKLLFVLASPLRAALTAHVSTGVSFERFTVNTSYEMA